MRIFAVFYNEYEDRDLRGVFSSQATAERFLEKLKSRPPHRIDGTSAEIEEHELDADELE